MQFVIFLQPCFVSETCEKRRQNIWSVNVGVHQENQYIIYLATVY